MASFPALPSGNNPYIPQIAEPNAPKKKRGDGWDVKDSSPLPMPTDMEAES